MFFVHGITNKNFVCVLTNKEVCVPGSTGLHKDLPVLEDSSNCLSSDWVSQPHYRVGSAILCTGSGSGTREDPFVLGNTGLTIVSVHITPLMRYTES